MSTRLHKVDFGEWNTNIDLKSRKLFFSQFAATDI